MSMFRDRRLYGANGSTKHVTLRGFDQSGNFFTNETGIDVRDEVSGKKIAARDVRWNYGKLVDGRRCAGTYDATPADLAFAFLGLATYDTETLGVQQKPSGWNDGL